jgi:hypothetical protein
MSRPDDIRTALSIAVQAGGSVLLWGEPGIGKTSAIVALAESFGWHREVLIGSIRDATDFGGLPMRTEGGVVLAPPAWAVRVSEEHRSGRRSLLFLDELTTAQPSVQAAMLRLVLDRVAGEHALPDTTAVVAAANPPEVAVDGYDLAPPLANRFCHLDWPVDARSWCEGIVAGWSDRSAARLPGEWANGIATWNARVAGFISHRPSLLHAMPADPAAVSRGWPSPRSWQASARLMAAANAADPEGGALIELLIGSVGDGAASEFLAWLDAADLPDPEAVLSDPSTLDLPMRGDRLLAVLGGVVGSVSARLDEDRWQRAWAVLHAATSAGHADVAAVSARSLLELRRPAWELPDEIEAFAPILHATGAVR